MPLSDHQFRNRGPRQLTALQPRGLRLKDQAAHWLADGKMRIGFLRLAIASRRFELRLWIFLARCPERPCSPTRVAFTQLYKPIQDLVAMRTSRATDSMKCPDGLIASRVVLNAPSKAV